jgi:nitrogen regulatory protein PII
MHFKLIVAMVKTTETDHIVEAAQSVGSTMATIIPARGTGKLEAKTFFGLHLEAQTDVVLFLLEQSLVEPVLHAIYEKGNFSKPGTGIAFVIDVESAVGMEGQVERFRKFIEKGA